MSFFSRTAKSDRLQASLETLKDRTQTLYKAVEPEPTKLGYIGAGTIGAKAENVRQGINGVAGAIRATAKDNGGKLTDEQALSIHRFFMQEMIDLIENTLTRMSTVHYQRFCQLGMGIPSVVKMALGWFVSSDKSFNEAYESSVGNQELMPQVKELDARILRACENAHNVYSGISE